MSKKYLIFLLPIALMLAVGLMLKPSGAAASQLLGITITPTPETPPPTEETPPPTEETPVVTETPPVETQPVGPTNTPSRPRPTEQVLLPETGEFPINPGQGLQYLFGLLLILLVGTILYRAVKGSRTQN
jgi:hypothetical protein